ncbi:MAG: hypothetical protein KKD44_03980 [Proteobacteria bacterium]|nr:hypothetical protein [Pseudomonadota bacterium]
MARIARAVAPGIPHHITQHGNRRQQTFFAYIEMMSDRRIGHRAVPGRISTDAQDLEIEMLRKHERTGRPIGDDSFIERLELILERILKPQKPGPKGKDK